MSRNNKSKKGTSKLVAGWKDAPSKSALDIESDSETIEQYMAVGTLPHQHPVRTSWCSRDAKARHALHHLADDLRLGSSVEGFAGLVKRMRTDADAFDDMRYELRVAGMLARASQKLVSFGGSQAGPDVEFVSDSGHRCGIACYRARSATTTVTAIRKVARRIAKDFFQLFHLHAIAGDWLLDVLFPEVPLRGGDVKYARDALHLAWTAPSAGAFTHSGIRVNRRCLPAVTPLTGQLRRTYVRFFFPVREAEKKRVLTHVIDKIEKERPWAQAYPGVSFLSIEESDGVLGGVLRDEFAALAQIPQHPFGGILLTSARVHENSEWIGAPSAPASLDAGLATFGDSTTSWANGKDVVSWTPEHAKEEWSFFQTHDGTGSELVRSLHGGVHCVRITPPSEELEPASDPEYMTRVEAARARIVQEYERLHEANPGVVPFLPDY